MLLGLLVDFSLLLGLLVGFSLMCFSLFHCELKCKARPENVTTKSASLVLDANCQIMIIARLYWVGDIIRPEF